MAEELLTLVLPLRFRAAPEQCAARPAPEWWGRAVQAWFLSVVKNADPEMAAALHAENRQHPYAVSSLIGCPDSGFPKGTESENLRIRISSMDAELSSILKTAAAPGGMISTGKTVELDYMPFEILETPEDTRWEASFADLVQRGVEQAEDPSFSFRFVSPLVFRSDGKSEALPLPRWVFQSLLNRWNAFAPIQFPQETLRYAEECLAISSFRIASRAVPLKQNGIRIGAVGSVRYRALNHDRYWISLLHSLIAFAPYSSVGAGTAFGLGQTRN